MVTATLDLRQLKNFQNQPLLLTLDYYGKTAELEAEGLLSHCVPHEIDHLNGVLFVDYLSNLKRKMMLRKVEKMFKQGLI